MLREDEELMSQRKARCVGHPKCPTAMSRDKRDECFKSHASSPQIIQNHLFPRLACLYLPSLVGRFLHLGPSSFGIRVLS